MTIPSTVTNIGPWAFDTCHNLASINIGNNVTYIDNMAFGNCYSLSSIVIPTNVTTIGSWAFGGCIGLTNMTIPDSVINIGDYAFTWCDNLTNVTVGSGVSLIGGCAFSGCSNLLSIAVSSNNNSYCSTNGVLFSKNMYSLIQFPGGMSGSYMIPDGVRSIESNSFAGCETLLSVNIPNSVTNIGYCAFSGCLGITEITIPDSVKGIGESAFNNCDNMATVVVGNNLLLTIGDWAFSWCDNLAGIYFLGSPPSLDGEFVFGGSDNATVFHLSGAAGWPTVPFEWAGRPTALTALSISPASTNVPSTATSDRIVGVTGNAPWTAVTNRPWIIITSGASGSTNGLVTYSVATNPGTSSRTGFITVAGAGLIRTCTVIQAGASATLAIAPPSTNLSSAAASGRIIGVTANVSWTASSNVSWIVVTGGSSGVSNGTVTFSVATNPATSSRTGAVVVSGGGISRTCMVTQAGAAATMAISPASTNFSSAAASGRTIGVTGNIPWTAVSNASWIAITGGSSGVSNGTVTFSVATNPATSSRTGAVVVAGGGISRTCMVTQAGAAAALAISPASTNFSSAAASGRTIGVTGNIPWTAVSNASWIAITGGSSGVSNGTVTFSVASNPATSSRTGAVVVAGGGISRTCTVIQAGAAIQRIIGLSGNLDFGSVVTGQTTTAIMTISNEGNAVLTVASIDYPEGFSGAWNGIIAIGDSTNLSVTFSPVALITYSGTATINSDKTSGENAIGVSGTGAIWRPTAEYDESFGVQGGQFGFNISWATGQVVVIDACTNLAVPIWTPLQTNTLTDGLSYFGDSEWTNHIGRFYRIRSQ